MEGVCLKLSVSFSSVCFSPGQRLLVGLVLLAAGPPLVGGSLLVDGPLLAAGRVLRVRALCLGS